MLDTLSNIHWFLLLKFAKASKRFCWPWGLLGLASALDVCFTAGIHPTGYSYLMLFAVMSVIWVRPCAVCSLRPWDSMNDVVQYEHNMVIQTKTRHQTPIVLATSLLHVDDLSRGHRRTRSRCLGSTSVHRLHRDGSSSSDCLEMFSAHELDFSGTS